MLSMYTIPCRCGMGRQTFAGGKLCRNRAKRTRAFARNLNDAGALLKIVNTQCRGKARCAGSGEHVVRPGTVIADRLGGIPADENSPGMSQLREPLFGVIDGEFQMLW